MFLTLLKKIYKKGYHEGPFSQEGEDLILDELHEHTSFGCYVDIGAFDPWKYSNTALFYKRGWSGVNIDPRPGFKKTFDIERPRDSNLECAIGLTKTPLRYYQFEEPALNTLSEKRAKFLLKNTNYKLKNIQKVKVVTLEAVFKKFCLNNVDFLNIDVEGTELTVLRSGNWKKYRPKYIVIEILNTPFQEVTKNPCIKMMANHGYELLTKGLRSVILKTKK